MLVMLDEPQKDITIEKNVRKVTMIRNKMSGFLPVAKTVRCLWVKE